MYCSLYFSSRSNICILSELIFVIVDVLHVEKTWHFFIPRQSRIPYVAVDGIPPVTSLLGRSWLAAATGSASPASAFVRTYVHVHNGTYYPRKPPHLNVCSYMRARGLISTQLTVHIWLCLYTQFIRVQDCNLPQLRTQNLLSNQTCVRTYVSNQLSTILIIDTWLCLRTWFCARATFDHAHLSSLLHRCVFVRVASIR